jgi:hypothetical protein
VRRCARLCRVSLVLLALACGSDTPVDPGIDPIDNTGPVALPVIGRGTVTERATTEVWAHGNYAYTATGARSGSGGTILGNCIKIWNVSSDVPVLVDSVIVADASKLSDIQVSDDGRLLVVSTEFAPGSILVYSLTDPARPALLSRFNNANTNTGVHTVEVARVNGILHAFLSTDAQGVTPSNLVIADLSDPANPRQVFARGMGAPFIHDVVVRDGILFTMLWNSGVEVFDIGGGNRGGSTASPVSMGLINTRGGRVHNGWWYHDPSGSKRYLFVGEEGPSLSGTNSSGDIHVVDITDLGLPREVAFYSVANAGTHNFSVDEERGILYAAYYNGGVRAIDIRGDLSACAPAEHSPDGRCDLVKMKRERGIGLLNAGISPFVWGVHLMNRRLYVSDMFTGLWVLGELPR